MAEQTTASSAGEGGAEGDLPALFKLLDDFCTLSQLRALIRIYRPNSADYPIGVTSEVAHKLILKLHGSGHLPRQRLEEMLERAEENGRQHIFFYAPASNYVRDRLTNFAAIEPMLLDGRTRAEAGLPRFQVRPRNIDVADLRAEVRDGTRYSSWTFKLYVGAERWVLVGKPIVNGDDKTVHYKRKYRRDVLVAKWHSFGLLEIRIPIGPKQLLVSSRDHLKGRVEAALEELGAGGPGDPSSYTSQDDAAESLAYLVPMALPKGLDDLDSAARDPTVKWISVSETELDVDGVKVTLGVDDEYDSIYAADGIADLVATAKRSESKTERLRVAFHLRRGTDDEEKFNVGLCGSFKNEVRVGARTSPEAVEFMVRRIWEKVRDAELPESPVDAMASDEAAKPNVSPADFDAFALRHPALAAAVRRLYQWIESHPTARYVPAERLRKELGTGLTNYDAAAAVGKFVEEGLLTCKYRVRARGVRRMSPEIFDSVGQLIEQGAADEDGEPIDLEHADVYPVYSPAVTRPPDPEAVDVDPGGTNGSPRKAAG